MRITVGAAWWQEPPRVTANVLKTPRRWRSTAAVQDVAPVASDDWQRAQPFEAIPGPKSAPIIGQLWHFIPGLGAYGGLKQGVLFEKLHKQYGPIVKLKMPTKDPLVFLQDPDDFEILMRNEGQWPIRRSSPSLQYWQKKYRANAPESLATAQGKDWAEFRTAVNQVMLQPRVVKSYVEPIDAVTRDFISRMRHLRDGKGEMPDNFSDELGKWSMESITYVALDTRLGAIESQDPNSEAVQMVQALRVVFKCMFLLDFRMSPWRYITTPALRDMMKSMNYVNSVTEKYITQAMERLRSSQPAEVAGRNLTVLEKLLLGTDDKRMAVVMAMDMIGAGIDTTSVGVSVVLCHLATNPDKQRKLQEELDRVLPDRSQPITKEQLEQLKYVRACIKEATRIDPVANANMRNAGKDLVLRGYRIPKGTGVITNNYLACANEAFFPKAREFLPERWLPEQGSSSSSLKAKHPFAYLPFGFGPRMCVGRRFADLEMEIFTARAFQNFTIEWHHPPPETETLSLLRFISPLKFTVKDR